MNSSILIITINYNQTDFTVQCVKSILYSEYKNFRILLVDNGSSKENYKELKQNIPHDPRIEVHRLEINKGYVGGVNFGLRESKKLDADYIIIMNNDVIIDPRAISELVKTCKKWDNKAIVTGKCYYYDNPGMIQTVGFKFKNKKTLTTYKIGEGELDKGQYDEEAERDLIDDVYWLFPSGLVNTIGLYPNYYGFGYEQADWALAAKKNGYHLIYAAQAKLWHKVNGTVGINLSPYKIYWSLQGLLMFQWKYISKIAFIQCYLLTILEIIAAFYYEVRRLFSNSTETRFPFIKVIAFIRFHFWLIFKMDKDKFNLKME